MIDRAKFNYPKISFLEADVLDIPFKDNTFDIVFATSLLNISVHKKKAISELARTCKNGGIVSILVPCDQFTNEHLRELLLSIGNTGFSATALKTWLKEHLIKSIRNKRRKKCRYFLLNEQ